MQRATVAHFGFDQMLFPQMVQPAGLDPNASATTTDVTDIEDLKTKAYGNRSPFDFPDNNFGEKQRTIDLTTSFGIPYEEFTIKGSSGIASKDEASSVEPNGHLSSSIVARSLTDPSA
ncbi:hypothetical protein ACH5RR_023168 [Cinchona calisaya]|uniref:Uncharacterized protein n=1 Tax=Cinchona calisaya TaxID=153742 RepID=A0ABD2ZBS0_9GENT